jgi:S-adenosylmethionine synthetase
VNVQLIRRTAESVAPGHPDKLADIIADRIVDEALSQSPEARVAIEVLVSAHQVVMAGQLSGAQVHCGYLAAQVLAQFGYGGDRAAVRRRRFQYVEDTGEQSAEIAGAVGMDGAGAGDQGIVVGYACNETDELMPAPILYANDLQWGLAALQEREADILGPDGKVQVTLAYETGRPLPINVETIVIAQQHRPNATKARVEELCREAIRTAIPEHLLDEKTRVLINPSGSFIVGGPEADTGLTGRKLAVDAYGPAVPHGGGALSGKDPSKTDRSGSYAARFVAKNVVAAKLADRCLVEVAYAIGVREPVAFRLDTFGTGLLPDWQLAIVAQQAFSFAPKDIRQRLDLARPIYAVTASFGHFGRTPTPTDDLFPWEKLDLVDDLLTILRADWREGR